MKVNLVNESITLMGLYIVTILLFLEVQKPSNKEKGIIQKEPFFPCSNSRYFLFLGKSNMIMSTSRILNAS